MSIKKYRDMPEVQKKMAHNKAKIDEIRSYKGDFEDLGSLYLEGTSKLNSEYKAALKVNENKRRIVLVEDSFA